MTEGVGEGERWRMPECLFASLFFSYSVYANRFLSLLVLFFSETLLALCMSFPLVTADRSVYHIFFLPAPPFPSSWECYDAFFFSSFNWSNGSCFFTTVILQILSLCSCSPLPLYWDLLSDNSTYIVLCTCHFLLLILILSSSRLLQRRLCSFVFATNIFAY